MAQLIMDTPSTDEEVKFKILGGKFQNKQVSINSRDFAFAMYRSFCIKPLTLSDKQIETLLGNMRMARSFNES
ncbi:TPA: hypothetical protein HA241_05550 [Candidatus Woesearchaeota archaeon]|nr:hypothetical protein [Candidatus Woesearchaeota archaeon]